MIHAQGQEPVKLTKNKILIISPKCTAFINIKINLYLKHISTDKRTKLE